VFNNNSNSYGAGYADNLTKALSVGPLLSLWNGTTNTDLTVTLFADADTPASAQYLGANIGMGYQTPVINNYVAPPIGGYGSLTDIGGSATFSTNNITFNFAGSNVFLDTAIAEGRRPRRFRRTVARGHQARRQRRVSRRYTRH